ncbi:DMT family transporter [Sphingomonas sp. SCN 67-18]|uniref:DMT family transporter n=1 Tax=uncultured Sphingomonas sp. TaxID=158754 RepID=UPI000AF44CA0|nr:DMT family transporter [Sphingomonas sp. SCN 67-18]
MSATQDRRMASIALRLFSMVLMSSMLALVKIADMRGVAVVESVFYRQFFALPLVLIWVVRGGGFATVKTKRPFAHLWRMALGMTGMVLNFSAYTLLPLAEATTIGFTVPIFATILSAVLLGEATGWHRWSAVLLGFVGVLVMVNPGVDNHLPPAGVMVAIAASITIAGITITLRQIGRTEDTVTTVFWFTVTSLVPMGIAMIFFGKIHDPLTWVVLVAMGLVGGAAQLAMTASLRFAPVSVVLPMDYSSLLWATLLGWALFDMLPSPTTWLGAPLIILSGLYIVYREHRLQRSQAMTAVTPD